MLAARLGLQIVLVSAAFRFLPLNRALKLINPRRTRTKFLFDTEIEATHRKFVRATDALLSINRLMFTPTCWKRAAIIYRRLAATGVDARIVFGVRHQSDSLDGHAWVEVFDKPVFETVPLNYERTFSFPA
ncbi:MAG: lasso peptide biosynthesis B2 protein [Pyrinomonadaceae bacterium MAG19_C2-C3]|nr:lasso peptide biosynthesis B2 protein [Pyrinomonadaceae bacterium MAG19_C2-C3]